MAKKESAAAQRILAAFAGVNKNPNRVTAGSFGGTARNWTSGVSAGGVKGAGGGGQTAFNAAEKSVPPEVKKKIMSFFGKKSVQAAGGVASILLMLSQFGRGVSGDLQTSEMEAEFMGRQADLITPEAYYQQAMLPQLQEQERGAKQAVLGRLASGGVLGPSLAKGEYSIGG